MPLTEKKDFVFYESALMMNSRQPMKNVDVCLVSTKDYIFFVPKKSVGMFVVVNTMVTHEYFDGVSIEQGVQSMIENSDSVQDLEKSMKELLEYDEKYVHKISDKSSFKFRGFLGRHTLRMNNGGTNWCSVMVKGKGNSKEFRQFHDS